jgi:hypothetical protein
VAAAILIWLAAACHRTARDAMAPANQGGVPSRPSAALARCGMAKAGDLFGETLRGASGTCRRAGDQVIDDRGAVATISVCGIAVTVADLPDDVGARVGDDLRAVVARYPAGARLRCRPGDGDAICGLLWPGDDGDPIVQYHLAASIPAPADGDAALAALGAAPVTSYFEQDGCD